MTAVFDHPRCVCALGWLTAPEALYAALHTLFPEAESVDRVDSMVLRLLRSYENFPLQSTLSPELQEFTPAVLWTFSNVQHSLQCRMYKNEPNTLPLACFSSWVPVQEMALIVYLVDSAES